MIELDKKFYTGKYDRAFKEVMLNEKNKDLLKLLLEHILKVEINNIEISPNERNSRNIKIKRKIYDALLTTNIGKIEIEVNSNIDSYVHPRNMAYISDLYSHHTLIGESYDEDTQIIQINFTYGLMKKKEKKAYREYYIQDKEGKKFVKNFKIIEINMDYYNKIWYDKKEKEIEKEKIIVMLGLDKKELKELSKEDKVVLKYMEELERVNRNPEIWEYMSREEDERKIINTKIKEGFKEGVNIRNKEIATNLLNKNIDVDIITEVTGLSKKEIKKLK